MVVSAILLLFVALGILGVVALNNKRLPETKPEPVADRSTKPDKEIKPEQPKPIEVASSGDKTEVPSGGPKLSELELPRLELPAVTLPPLEIRPDPIVHFPLRPMPAPNDPPKEPIAPVEPKVVAGRLDNTSEDDLRSQLLGADEIGLGAFGPAVLNAHVANLREQAQFSGTITLVDASPLVRTRPDLNTLPLRHGVTAQLQPAAAATMDALSRKLRVYLNSVGVTGGAETGPAALREVLSKEMRGKRPEWLRPEAVPTMVQMMMPEDTPIRQILVDMLAEISGPRATEALAQRAVFDLDAEVRRSAALALKTRKPVEYRAVFLRGLRYPWAPPAQHAAEALALLDDRTAIPELVMLLKQPDPALPVVLNRQHAIIRDVVRTNHLNNCLLCHPPAASFGEPVLGVDPVVSIPVSPALAAAVNRLQARPGSHNYGNRSNGPSTIPLLIRGDITFMRQDFSVKQPVGLQTTPTGTSSNTARFDYVVRTRYFPVAEAQRLNVQLGDKPYPQREAVLFALRTLTGKDVGTTLDAWLEAYPGAEQAAAAALLSRRLQRSAALDAEILLNKVRNDKGEENTMALVSAIPGMKGKLQDRARQFLVERLGRLSPQALCEKLRDEDSEMRQAVLQVCQGKEKKEVVPELLALLEAPDPLTARTAETALREVTGQTHSTPADWQSWWKKQ
jgi:HEAT repeat protein